MKRPYKKKYRGNLFYYIFASFFIVILICTIIITFQYISYLDTANKNIENSYDSVALKAENNSDTYLSICYDFAEDLSEIKKEIAVPIIPQSAKKSNPLHIPSARRIAYSKKCGRDAGWNS